MGKTIKPAPDGSGTYAELDGADFTGEIKAPVVISPDFSATDDALYRFALEDDYAANVSLRTTVPETVNLADKSNITFTYGRATVGTFEDAEGGVHTAAVGVPRFGGTNYNSTTGEHSQIDSNGDMIPTSPAFEGTMYAFGDSLTDGQQTWYPYFQDLMTQRIDFSGALAGAYLNKESPEISSTEDDILDFYSGTSFQKNVSLIVIEGGHNDLKQIVVTNTEDVVLPLMKTNMALMIEDAVTRSTHVYVMPVPVSGQRVGWTAEMETAKDKFNSWLKNFCATTGATYLEIDTILESPTTPGSASDRAFANDQQTLTRDGLHWNTLGSRLVAEYMFSKLDRPFIKGLLLEGDAENLLLHSADFSNVAWVATNATKAAEATIPAPDGSTDTYSITATADGGKVVQDLGILAEANGCFSFWIKRKTGSGRVRLSFDGGEIAPKLANIYVDDTWRRVYLNTAYDGPLATLAIQYLKVTDPDPSIILETSGDAVYVWGAQYEQKEYPTSYIATVAALGTKDHDTCSWAVDSSFMAQSISSLGLTTVPLWCGNERFEMTGSNNQYLLESSSNASRFSVLTDSRSMKFIRFATGQTVNNFFIGAKSYGLTTSAIANGQTFGGLSRGQVISFVVDYSWSTGENMVVNGYSQGSINQAVDSGTNIPTALGTTVYMNRRQGADDKWWDGYVRDLYINTTLPPVAKSIELSDEVNKW